MREEIVSYEKRLDSLSTQLKAEQGQRQKLQQLNLKLTRMLKQTNRPASVAKSDLREPAKKMVNQIQKVDNMYQSNTYYTINQ